jgi:hypothetical protein
MDGEGNAFVNGRSQGNYTVKYSAASGQVLWERRDSFGSPGALAVDVHGNVIVGGTHTAKYAATNGALLWDRKIDQSSNGPVFIRAIALDPVGNVFLGGMGYRNNDPQKDFFTTKYAAADGALLWQLYDDGPGERDDRIERQGALAVGPNGMVAITGTSGGFGGEFYGHDFTTVVYRDTLGAPPQISIAAPANGSQWLAGSTITLVADVTDPDAIVDSVEFLAGDTSLGISSSSPWTVTWANVPAGTHTLTARAMDPLGPITVSATVAITVTNPPPGPTVNLLATDRLARERSPYLQPDTATFIVHRSGSLNSSLTVYYDLAGSASNGVDYLQLPGSVTIPIGQRFARIVVVPRKDAIREGQEDVRITLRPPPAGAASYTLGKYSQANVYIFD